MRRERFGHVLLIALCLSAPAFAYTASGVDDANNPGIDNPGLDVTRHAMPPPDVTAKPAEAPTVVANPLWAIPLSALAATRTRPLFTPSRRPPAPVVASVPVAAPRAPSAPPSAVPQHPNLTLVGTVAGENEGVAVFIDTATRDTVRLRTGEGHSGWILQSVERRSATLQKGDQTEKLALPRPNEQEKSAPVVSTLPPPPSPPPPPSGASAPAKAPQSGGCMPEPVGC
jgi:general secretion pathway protein N